MQLAHEWLKKKKVDGWNKFNLRMNKIIVGQLSTDNKICCVLSCCYLVSIFVYGAYIVEANYPSNSTTSTVEALILFSFSRAFTLTLMVINVGE